MVIDLEKILISVWVQFKTKEHHILQYLQQACDWGTFDKLELDKAYPAGPIIRVGTERSIWFLRPLNHQKMQFPKTGKYPTINKSTTFPHFWYPYVNFLKFALFPKKRQKTKQKENSGKNHKNHMPAYQYLHQLPWIDCAVVKLSQKKKQFQYQDVF